MMPALSEADIRAKVFLAKAPLKELLPLISTFLLTYSVRVEAHPKIFPAYVIPKPEIVLAHQAVEELPVYKLRTILLHEAIHPALNVWGRYLAFTGKSFQDPDWELFARAHDHVVNLLINEEIKRLDRLQLNGQKEGQEPLLQWPSPADGPAYGYPELNYAYWGMSLEDVFVLLKRERAEGKRKTTAPNDCVYDGSSLETIRIGHEKAQRSLFQAAREAADIEGERENSDLVRLLLSYAKPKESYLSAFIHEVHHRLPCRERRSYARPDTRYSLKDTGGVFRPGIVQCGDAVWVCVDVSGSTHSDKSAERFIEEVDAALDAWEGVVVLILWDNKVRMTMVVVDRYEMRQAVQKVLSGGTTSLENLVQHLQDLQNDDYGCEVPAPGLIIIRTDGEVPHWPDLDEFPCDEVMVVYTQSAPPAEIPSMRVGAAA